MVNVQSLTVFFRSLAASLANFIAFTSQSALDYPRYAVISFVSAVESWMQFAFNIFCPPFSITSGITENVLAFTSPKINIFSRNWFSAKRTWRAAGGSVLFGIAPSVFCTASIRTSKPFAFQRWAIFKRFSANNTGSSNWFATVITKITVCLTMKIFFACNTFSYWLVTVGHKNIITHYVKFNKELII